MPSPIWILNDLAETPPALRGADVALRTDGAGDLARRLDGLRKSGGTARFAVLDLAAPLAALPVEELPEDLPLLLRPTEIGPWAAISPLLPALKRRRVHVCLPGWDDAHLLGARQLSAVGIPSSLDLRGAGENWDLLADLAAWALLERMPHGTIDPFSLLGERPRDEATRRGWCEVFLDDPRRFGHVAEDGEVRILSSSTEALCKVEELDDERWSDAVTAWRTELRRPFLHDEPCARCPAWTFCGGLVDDERHHPRCRDFFLELESLVETARATRDGEGVTPWRP